VLHNLGITIARGTATALLGPNGAGKTTLLHLCLGLLNPSSGRVFIMGEEQSPHSNGRMKQRIGLVPQNESIPFDLSVMEYVLLGRAPFLRLLQQPGSKDVAIAEQALENVGMSAFRDRAVPSLSGGERQMVAIARTLTQNTDILLLDEPTAHLDLPNGRRVLSIIKKIAAEGRTVVFSTHDPNAASIVADQVVLLGRDGLVASGSPSQTLNRSTIEAAYNLVVDIIESPRGPVVMAW
jgi:iron complex transport system ATP-binding protein